MLLYAFLAALWGYLIYPVIINQPVDIVSRLLRERDIVANGAVITTIEAIAGIFISVSLLDNYFKPKGKRKKTMFVLKVIPGVIFLLAVAYFELMFFKWRVGGDFLVTALLFCTATMAAVFGISYMIKIFATGESMKLEMKLLLNMLILFTGLLINSSVADYNIPSAKTSVELTAMFSLIALAALLFVAGIFIEKYKINVLKLIKKSN